MCIGWFFVGWGELVIEIIHESNRVNNCIANNNFLEDY